MPAAPKVFRTSVLTGGINTTASPDNLPVFPKTGVPFSGTQFLDIENFYPIDRGGLRKVLGFAVDFDTETASPIRAIKRFIKTDGTNQFIYAQGTHVYIKGTASPIATIDGTSTVHFEVGNNLLVICDGVNQMQYWDGSSVTSNANASLPTAASACVFYQNRFWFITNNSPNQNNAYYSAPNDITKGYGDTTGSGGFVQCDYNDGDVIVGMVSTFLSNSSNPVLTVAKNRKLGIIDNIMVSSVTGETITYRFSAIDTVIGAASSYSMCRVGQDVYYLNRLGLTAAKTQVNYNQLFQQYLSVDVSNQFNSSANIATLDNAILFYDYLNYRVCAAINEVGFDYPNVLWCYDIRLNSWYKERWGNPNNITSAYIDTNGTFYHGDSNGKIYVHGTQYSSFNGSVISSYFTLPFIDFGDPSAWKQIQLMTASIRGGSMVPITVTHQLDFGATNAIPNSLQPSTSPYIWGGGVWTADPGVYQWGAATLANRRFWPKAYFRNISTRFSHSDTSNDLEIFNISWDVIATSHR